MRLLYQPRPHRGIRAIRASSSALWTYSRPRRQHGSGLTRA